MISEETKAYYDLKKRNDVRESAKRIRRQFLRYKDAEIIYSLQHKKILELASEAGAIYRMDGTVLINRDIFVVVESRYTFHIVPSAKFLCEIFKYLLRLIGGVNFGQGDNQLPCFDTLSVCSASSKLLLTLFGKIAPKGIVCCAVGGIEVFLSCVACNIRYSSLDIGQL